MKKYFWREKNADSCKGKGQIILPTREELERELILKLEQKLGRMALIFDKEARMEYFLKDKKPKRIKIDDLSEEEIQRVLGKNVIIDFLQVLMDLCNFYEIDFNTLSSCPQKIAKEGISAKIKENIDNLLSNKKIKQSIEQIYTANIALANLLKLDLNDIEKQRKIIEQKEGCFFKGKYVVFDE